ncbi:MAG TPA: hypothetical protein VK165_20275 [Azonexus sp.]|nr:hypothetical protein [Azonexus sp.]
MKIFQMNDCDWWIGESLAACTADIIEYTGDPDCVEFDAHELTDHELDTLIFTDCDQDEVPTGMKRTFREQLAIEIAAGGKFPRMFACTEY